jgi:hypothetical protein
MKPNPLHRLPAPLEAAVQRLKLAAREAAERTIESLGLAALASSNAFHRDGLLGAQFELNRKSAVFALSFNDALDERILRELGPRAAEPDAPPAVPTAPTNWASLSLVDDKDVEAQISADRFGMEIAHACEWELRELEGYVSSLLGEAGGERDRNPLRPDLVGHAMIRGIAAVSEREDIRKVLSAELGRSFGGLLARAYADIVAEMRNAGVQPVGLMVRNRPPRGASGDGDDEGSDFGLLDRGSEFDHGAPRGGSGAGSGRGARRGGGAGGTGPSTHAGMHTGTQAGNSAGNSATAMGGRAHDSFGTIDPALMTLIRRLNHVDHAPSSGGHHADDIGGAPPTNLIRAHRDELRQASQGALDHMVIDVIGFLFDQIMADPKVPPQMARLIARLQLPVLRAALGDPSFFSSRRHPVRRFINRIASLGAAFEDYGDERAQAFLLKVKALIQEVVDGDFDQIDLYEQKLAALETFTTALAEGEAAARDGSVALLAEKEDQQRLRQLYAQRLEGELKGVDAPPFLRDFLSRIWSQVLVRATEQAGADGPLTQRLRTAGRELFLSVQPKATPAHRKAFLAELPRLMQELTEGMNLIGWPEAQRRAFFGRLMPAHAEALKSPAGRQLEINLMARQVEGALHRPLPTRDELRAVAATLPVLTEEIAPPALSAEEARRVGLVDEAAVDWNGSVDIDLSAEPAAPAELPVAGLPSTKDPADPTEGRALAEHVQIGFAYQMHVDGQWQKVRLSHVSPGRGFFMFTHGGKHRKTVSLTQRMLVRLCETGRLKAYESAYLVERATARARRQLAALTAAQPG